MVNLRDPELFELYAFRYYKNDKCLMLSEFKVDLKRFKSVSNLINNWGKSKLVSERLILNHIITLRNLFGEFASLGLFAKTDPAKWSILKTLLLYLNMLPKGISLYDSVKISQEMQSKLDEMDNNR